MEQVEEKEIKIFSVFKDNNIDMSKNKKAFNKAFNKAINKYTTKIVKKPVNKVDLRLSKIKSFSLEKCKILGTLIDNQVYKIQIVKSLDTQKLYILTIYSKLHFIETQQVIRFFRELDLYTVIDSEYLESYEGFYQDNKFLFTLHEFFPGGCLFSQLRRQEIFTIDISKFYFSQTILAIEYLHKNNIIYRNLRPERHLICSDGYIKLSDFSVSKKMNENEDITFTVCSTPNYMAPEMILHKGYSFSVDYWGLGVLLYEYLLGIDPFADENVMKIYSNILNTKPYFPQNFNNDAYSLINHLIEKDLTKRYGNMSNKFNDIKNHRFFKDFDFLSIINKTATAPFIPELKHKNDISYYPLITDTNFYSPAIEYDEDPFWKWCD